MWDYRSRFLGLFLLCLVISTQVSAKTLQVKLFKGNPDSGEAGECYIATINYELSGNLITFFQLYIGPEVLLENSHELLQILNGMISGSPPETDDFEYSINYKYPTDPFFKSISMNNPTLSFEAVTRKPKGRPYTYSYVKRGTRILIRVAIGKFDQHDDPVRNIKMIVLGPEDLAIDMRQEGTSDYLSLLKNPYRKHDDQDDEGNSGIPTNLLYLPESSWGYYSAIILSWYLENALLIKKNYYPVF